VNVNVDGDAVGPATRNRQNQIRAFRTHASKAGEHVEVAWQFAAKSIDSFARDLMNCLALGA
jgi:hypothetical protein